MTDRGDTCLLMPLCELGQLAPGLHRGTDDLEVPGKKGFTPVSELPGEKKLETDLKCLGSEIRGSHNHSPYGTLIELVSNFIKGAPKKKMLH